MAPALGSASVRRNAPVQWLALAGFAAAGPLAIVAPKGLWIAGLLIALARLVHLLGRGGGWRSGLGDARRLGLLWLLVALGLTSALWTVVPAHSLERGLRLVLEFGAGALIIGLACTIGRHDARIHLQALAAGLILAAALAIADIELAGYLLRWSHGQPVAIYAYGPGAAFSALVLLPLAISLWQHRARLWAVAAAVAAAAFVLLAANETAKLALPLAVVGGLAAAWRWTRPLPALAFAVPLLAVPLLVPQPMDSPFGCWLMEQKLSIVHRLGIWNFVDAAVAERPVLGWGLEASRRIPGGTMQLAMPDCGPELGPEIYGPRIGERLPLHPHGLSMNLWLELGAVGVFLLLVVLLDWARRLYRLPRAYAWAPCAALSAVFLPATASFGMWQGWWLTTLFLLAAVCLLRPTAPADAPPR
ncbi:MAG: hypothetical protein ACFCVH_16940 [Alphaproteobacteria bacterium]